MTFLLRAMEAHDLPGVLELAHRSPEAPHWALEEYERLLDAQPVASSSLRLGVIALHGTTLIGFAAAAWLPLEAAAEIESMVIDLAFRRQGAGTALLRACMEWAARAGASAVRLEVRASNSAAIALYRKAGFAVAGVRRAYYTWPVEDALLLLAPLPLGLYNSRNGS